MSDYLFIEGDEGCSAKFFAWLPEDDIDPETDSYEQNIAENSPSLFKSPFESRHPWIGNKRKCPATIVPDTNSWIIYIPFDTCKFRLGGSILAQAHGLNGGQEPHIADPDYFIDCYEVIRELTEDGIIKAGHSVTDGGLAAAAEKMCCEVGLEIDTSGIMSSYGEKEPTKILFGEIPGALQLIGGGLILAGVLYYSHVEKSGS
jgi:hypothetical protein